MNVPREILFVRELSRTLTECKFPFLTSAQVTAQLGSVHRKQSARRDEKRILLSVVLKVIGTFVESLARLGSRKRKINRNVRTASAENIQVN